MDNSYEKPRFKKDLGRRSFLQYIATGITGSALIASGCHKDHRVYPYGAPVDMGSGNTGILNYVYALEQLCAAFYTQVLLTPYPDMSASEKQYLTAIRDHEIAHRELLKTVLGSKAIPTLSFNLSSINFSSRPDLLTQARTFKDLTVSAYNGAAVLISNADTLTLVAKIVSVEARHAALLHELLTGGSFSSPDQVDVNGFNKALAINDVLPFVTKYVRTRLTASSF